MCIKRVFWTLFPKEAIIKLKVAKETIILCKKTDKNFILDKIQENTLVRDLCNPINQDLGQEST